MLCFLLVNVPTIIICQLYWMEFGYQYDKDGATDQKKLWLTKPITEILSDTI